MVLASLGLVVGGIVALVVGAEGLVRGGSRLAAAFGVSSLVIGLTIVSLGTSTPELVVAVLASRAGEGAIAVGNVVGSNIANVLMVLGPVAAVRAIRVHSRVVRREVPIMILVSLLLVGLALRGGVSRVEGGLMVALLAAYIYYSYRATGKAPDAVEAEFAEYEADAIRAQPHRRAPRHLAWQAGLVVAGVALLALGGRLVVDGAVDLARVLGVSERVIGLTVVAIGTSLPELATGVVAAVRGQADIGVGNIVGSNIFNILGILGAAALVAPVAIPRATLALDLPVMVLAAVALLPLTFRRRHLSRREGVALAAAYVAYLALLLLGAP